MKTLESLTIQDAFLFGAVMQDEKICRRLLEEILERSIDRIVYLDREKSFDPGYFSRGIRLDVYVRDDDGTVINVEMQAKKKTLNGVSELPQRTRYYSSTLDVDQLGHSDAYQRLPYTIIIFICTFDEFNEDRYRYTFTARCKENPTLELGDGLTRIILNSRGDLSCASEELRAFLKYVNGEKDENDDLVQSIESRIKRIKADSLWRSKYMRYELEMMDARREGLVAGREDERLRSIKNLMKNSSCSAHKAMDILEIPKEEQTDYLKKLQSMAAEV